MATFSFVDCTDTTLTIKVSELPRGTVVVDWYIGTDKSSMPYKGYKNVSGSSCTYTFENLTPDSDYYVKIKAVDSDGGSLGVFTSPKQYSTDAPAWAIGNKYEWYSINSSKSQYLSFGNPGFVARFTVSFATSGTISFYGTGDDDSYGYISESSAFDSTNGGPKTPLAQDDDSGSGRNFKIDYAVEAGQTYYLWARMFGLTRKGSVTVHIDPPKKQIKSWHWLIQNVNAPEWMTSAAYNAITNSGPVSDFRYQVWNDLVKKVIECKTAAGVSWNAKYLTQNNTLMTDTDKTLTAARFNSLRYNIGIHASTGLTDVYKGDTVYGWYFTTLTDALNTWIDALNGN